MDADRRLCTFYVDHLWFAIAVERVKEVSLLPAITPVPLAPRAIAGLVNLRGQAVTVVDLRHRLGLAEHPDVMPSALVVVQSENLLVGLLVGETGEVVSAPEEALKVTPSNLSVGPRELISGVYKFPRCLLHVLELDQVLEAQFGNA